MEQILNATGSCTLSAEERPPSSSMPLRMLTEQLHNFFDCSLDEASMQFAALRVAARGGEWKTRRSLSDDPTRRVNGVGEGIDLKSCKRSAILVLLTVLSKDNSLQCARLLFDNYEGPLGLLTVDDMEYAPSTDLRISVTQAKQAAFNGKVPTCTILNVNLYDMENARRFKVKPNRKEDRFYSSFEHTLVLGIGREGWYVWQSHAFAYTLKDWLQRGGARVRQWKEMSRWLQTFAILTVPEVSTGYPR